MELSVFFIEKSAPKLNMNSIWQDKALITYFVCEVVYDTSIRQNRRFRSIEIKSMNQKN